MSGAGHQVHVLYLYKSEWATEADAEIFESAGWTHQLVGGSPKLHMAVFPGKLVRNGLQCWDIESARFAGDTQNFCVMGRHFNKPD